MRFEQLEYLTAITQLGSMRRASDELNISQPALSEAIRNLERELGVALLDRFPSGARISAAGQELLPYITEVLESVDRLRSVADEEHRFSRIIRFGTVGAATVTIVLPAIQDFRSTHPDTHVEMGNARQGEIHQSLLDGRMELGLINLLHGDDVSPELETVELVRGRAVVCCRRDSPLAALSSVSAERLRAEQLVVMRPGYVMHRFVHRILGTELTGISYATDGAEMGKLMVAQGLGVTVLPDYSIVGDPLERDGTITWRPLDVADDQVVLVLQRSRSRHLPQAVRRLEAAMVDRATAVTAAGLSASAP